MSARRIVASLIALTVILGPGCSGNSGGPTLFYGGSPVDIEALDKTLEAAATDIAEFAAKNHGVTHDDVACWAASNAPVEDAQALTGQALCGPVFFPQSDPRNYWAVYDLAIETRTDEDSSELVALPGTPILTTGEETAATPPGTLYVRPDGAEMPDESGLEVPPPPPAPNDLVVDVDPDELALEKPGEKVLQGLGSTFNVDGVGPVESTVGDGGATYGPPEDGQLYAVTFTVGGSSEYLRSARIEAGDRTVWEGGESEGPETVVFSVAEDEPITLILEEDKGGSVDPTTDPIVQHYDLRAGTVTDPIEVLYRNRQADPIKTIDIPCNWTEFELEWGRDDGEPCTERFKADAYLTYSYPLGYGAEIDTDFLVPERDQAVLVILSDQSAAWLVGGDGERIEPENPNVGGGVQDEWVFIVSADTTEVTLMTNTRSNRDEIGDPEKGIDHKTVITIPA